MGFRQIPDGRTLDHNSWDPFLLWSSRKFAWHTWLFTVGAPPVHWLWARVLVPWGGHSCNTKPRRLRSPASSYPQVSPKMSHHHLSSFSTYVLISACYVSWLYIFIALTQTAVLGASSFFVSVSFFRGSVTWQHRWMLTHMPGLLLWPKHRARHWRKDDEAKPGLISVLMNGQPSGRDRC